VAVLADGKLQQLDAPRVLYRQPANIFVAGFIGSPAMNLCTLPVVDGAVSFGGAEVAVPPAVAAGRGEVVLGLRPEALELASNGCDATVEAVEEVGADTHVFCAAELAARPQKLVARVATSEAPAQGERIRLRPVPAEAHFFDPMTGVRIVARPVEASTPA
jgi:multiple sugar transport system ATP-binding protein